TRWYYFGKEIKKCVFSHLLWAWKEEYYKNMWPMKSQSDSIFRLLTSSRTPPTITRYHFLTYEILKCLKKGHPNISPGNWDRSSENYLQMPSTIWNPD